MAWGLGLKASDVGLRVAGEWGTGFEALGLGFRIEFGARVQELRLWA